MPLPAIDSYDSLAGNLNDYSPVVDPTTDLPAYASNVSRADVAGMTRVSARSVVVWDTDGGVGNIRVYDSVVGNSAVNYPTLTPQATGVWWMDYPATCVDMLGNTQYWNMRWVKGSVSGPAPGSISVTIVSPTRLEVRLWDQNDNPSNLLNYTILVEVH